MQELNDLIKYKKKKITRRKLNPVSYTHLDVYKRQTVLRKQRDSNEQKKNNIMKEKWEGINDVIFRRIRTK